MTQLLNLTTIKKWIRDYRQNKQLANETNSVTIDLEKIKEFISYIDAQNQAIDAANQSQQWKQVAINAIRFYFTRQNNIADKNKNADGTINDNLSGDNNNLEVHERRMTLFYNKEFEPQSQISLLALPVINYNHEPRPENEYTKKLDNFRQHNTREEYWWCGKDYIPNNDEIHCLYARDAVSEHSGLCPYNCDGTMDGES